MFRNSKQSTLRKEVFSIGSVINGGDNVIYLVVKHPKDALKITLLNLKTFELASDLGVLSLDHGHLSIEEANELLEYLGDKYQYANSDFTFVQEGVKELKFRY